MEEIEKLTIEYEIKSNYALKDIDQFTFEDFYYIHMNKSLFNDFFKGGHESYKTITKEEFDSYCTHTSLENSRVSCEIMSKYLHKDLCKVLNSSNRYCRPKRKDKKEFYIFTYKELEWVFHHLLFKMNLDLLSPFKRNIYGSHQVSLNSDKYKFELEVYYIPVDDYVFLRGRFLSDYKTFIRGDKSNLTKLEELFHIVRR